MVNPLATLRQTKLRIDKVENASVPPNTERTLCNRTGPGVVVSLWMALGGGAAPALARVSNDHGFVALIMMVGFAGWWP